MWEPHRRGTTLRFMIPPLTLGSIAAFVSGIADGQWVYDLLGGLGFALLLAFGFLIVAFWNLRYVGVRRCIFTSEWVGIQCRHEIDLIRYSTIRTMWVGGDTSLTTWRPSDSGRIHFARTDGMPVRLPRLLTYTRRDREAFFDFVYSQAALHSLPMQDR